MGKNRNIRVRGVRRDQPDLRKLSRALIALAEAQLEVDAEASHATKAASPRPSDQQKNRRREQQS